MSAVKANCRKVICIGRNYADHIKELNNRAPSQPFFFLKPPSSILAPPHHRTPIQIPHGVKVHYEVELGLVIGHPPSSPPPSSSFSSLSSSSTTTQRNGTGPSSRPNNAALAEQFKPLRNLKFPNSPSEALQIAQNYIRSYVLAIDLTARNVQDEAKKKGLPWSIAKGFDTFLPISEAISPSRIPNPHGDNVILSLAVNDEIKQQDSTNLMLFRIPRILSDISKVMSLEEGDIVLTGTPKGVGPIVAGDRVLCNLEVDGNLLDEARIDIGVTDAPGEKDGGYVFRET